MELRTLRYFLTTANEGNISRAADILHVTQPTLSRQLMELERELGAVLMVRGKKGVTLTDDGVFFRQRAEEIVELADRAEKAFAERDNAVSGIITIGATEAVGSRLLAKIMKRFSEKYPLAQREVISVEEISAYPLILPLRENVRAEILNWIGKEERELQIPLYYTLLSNAVLMVDAGMGCAFCLDGALAIHSSPSLRFVPIVPEHTTRSVLLWKKNQLFTPVTSLFIQEINMLKNESRESE